MKYIFLMILFVVGCSDNKYKTRKNVPMPTTIEWSSYDESKPYIKLSYSNSFDIMLVESTINKVQEYILGRYLEKAHYNAIYWNSNNNTYYAVTNVYLFCDPVPVTKTNFVYALNNPNQIEPVFYPDYQEFFTNTGAPLLYIGDLSSPLERVYLDPTNQVYYIKKLAPFDSSIYESQPYADDSIYQTNTTPPIYPAMYTNVRTYNDGSTRIVISLIYTNENKQEFIIVNERDGEIPIFYD